MNLQRIDFTPSPRAVRLWWALAAVGALTFAAGVNFAPERIWPALLMASFGLLGLGLAGAVFVAIQYATSASWAVALRRVPEAMTAALPAGAAGLAVVLLARPELYPWFGQDWSAAEGPVRFKQMWLGREFFLARAAAYVLLWVAFAAALVRTSRRQDASGDPALTRKNVRLSAAFLVVFAFTFCLASFDWIMSLEPAWYSTIFGVYNFAGLFTSGLAALALAAIWLRRRGPLRHTVTESHLLDLGRLIFAFSTFWAYLWFSQYMLIWYANLPEETSYFIRRLHGWWEPLFVVNLFINWGVPFLGLMPRANKQDPARLAVVCWVVLLGRALDLYLMIYPPFAPGGPVFGIWEAGLLAGAAGVFLLLVTRALREAPLLPVGDPYLGESLHYHA